MNELKSNIARGNYEVDASLLADEIVAKLRLIRRARAVLAGGPAAEPRVRSRRFRATVPQLRNGRPRMRG